MVGSFAFSFERVSGAVPQTRDQVRATALAEDASEPPRRLETQDSLLVTPHTVHSAFSDLRAQNPHQVDVVFRVPKNGDSSLAIYAKCLVQSLKVVP